MTAFVLKVIATLTMLIDHVGAVFPLTFPMYFRFIGRIAFPVYAYMIAQGCKHTSNINKYLLRLGIFALISEIPFDLAFGNEISFISRTNIFYTLFLGTACIAVFEKVKTFLYAPKANMEQDAEPGIEQKGRIKNKPLCVIIAALLMIPIALLGDVLDSDYGTRGVVCILIFYFAKPENRVMRTIAAVAVITYIYGYPHILFNLLSAVGGFIGSDFLMDMSMHIPSVVFYFFFFALISAVLICFYNGKPGPRVKWAFYAFYPGHLAVLALIKYLTG